jgi:serine/threonine-protein kinase RsbW
LVLHESLTNAVRHGNLEDSEKQVMLTVTCQNETIHIQVQDQGQGFDHLQAPSIHLDSPATSGRGRRLMALYCKSVTYNNPGNVIKLIKKARL